jgi:hypothetical protein
VVSDRIVSISQPHVRPIVRGKLSAPVEFGAKISVSVVQGFCFVDRLSWDNYNESGDLKGQIEKFKNRFGHYPSSVHADLRKMERRSYFIKIFDLHKTGLIKDKEIKGLVNPSDLALLFHVLKPMEEAIEKDLLELNIDKEAKEPSETMEFYKRLYREGKI